MSVTVTTRHTTASAIGGTQVEELHRDHYEEAINFGIDPMGNVMILGERGGLVTTENPEGVREEYAMAVYIQTPGMRVVVDEDQRLTRSGIAITESYPEG